jgi:hypothetical protein
MPAFCRSSLTRAQIRTARSHPMECSRRSVEVTTIRRAELTDSETSLTAANDLAIRRALEAAGVEFIDKNGGGAGVRLRKPGQKSARER